MKHQPIVAAHAPNCGCPRCRHLRAPRPVGGTAALAIVSAGFAGVFIILPAVAALARHLLPF